jgi:hypothetical protein
MIVSRMNEGKEQLQTRLKVLENLLILFGILVALGLLGEESRFPHFGGRLVALAATAEAILSILHVRKSRQLDALQEIEIASIKRDAADANRLAEQDRLARVKIEERLAPRFIAHSDRQNIIAALKPFASAGRMVDIVKHPDDAEVSELARQVITVLADSGWKPTMLPDAPVDSGVAVEAARNNPQNLDAGRALVSAFAGAGLAVSGPTDTLNLTLTGAAVRISVGRK